MAKKRSGVQSERIQGAWGWARIAYLGASSVLVGSLVLLAPVASASSTHVAPFHGAKWSSNNIVNNVCNTHGGWGVTPKWSNATGVGVASAYEKSTTCPAALGGTSYGSAVASTLTVAIPLRLPTGAHSVQATMNETMSGNQMVHIGGVCPPVAGGSGSSNCAEYTQYSSQITVAQLWDSTTNTYMSNGGTPTYGPALYNYTYAYNDTSCSSGTCTYTNHSVAGSSFPGNTVSASFTAYFNATFNHTHRYWVLLGIYIQAYEMIQGYPNSYTVASINMATFGNSFSVPAVKVV
ncbi:MAG TPA: hypothetical protein VFF67_01180 [Thermoplasmata archaeon]|nr:hypothetical protein [Thermoplasmata archaeon]